MTKRRSSSDGVVGFPAINLKDPPPEKKNGEWDDAEPDIVPLQVVLSKGTLFKFTVAVGSTVLVGLSGMLAFYWQNHYKVRSHMEDQTIHLKSGERSKLETKPEAQKHREGLVEEVKREVSYQHRLIRVQQDEQIKNGLKRVVRDLKRHQKGELDRLLRELKTQHHHRKHPR